VLTNILINGDNMLKNFTLYGAIKNKIMAQITNISKSHIKVNVSNNSNLTIT